MGKATVYIRVGNEERWGKKGKLKSEWLNKKLEQEAELEKQEAIRDPKFDEVTQTWSDAEL